jgi:cell division protein FtsW
VISFARTDRSVVGRWWWTVDRWSLAAIGLLIGAGVVLTLAASPAVAERIGYESFHFVRRQLVFLPPAILLMFGISLLSPRGVRRLGAVGLGVSIVMLALTLKFGPEVKGATRWLMIAGLSVQPSEFVKPCLAVTVAWMLALQKRGQAAGNLIAVLLYALVAALLMLQPDMGMTIVVTAVWAAQLFMAGLPIAWVGALGGLSALGGTAAYMFIPHVASRIDRFRDPSSGDSYQIDAAMDAFANGGLFGRGPGEGIVKRIIPDAHTDFIFAVAGEEFGLLVCLSLVALFAFVTLRGFSRLLGEQSLFVLLAGSGLLIQFGLQAVINLGVNLHLMPTKGMTLPFISYGGSSMLALALAMGMALALTRTRPHAEGEP